MNTPSTPSEPGRPAPMTVEALAEALRAAGSSRATASTIRADLAAGAPVEPDGRLDPVAYAAWLLAKRG